MHKTEEERMENEFFEMIVIDAINRMIEEEKEAQNEINDERN